MKKTHKNAYLGNFTELYEKIESLWSQFLNDIDNESERYADAKKLDRKVTHAAVCSMMDYNLSDRFKDNSKLFDVIVAIENLKDDVSAKESSGDDVIH